MRAWLLLILMLAGCASQRAGDDAAALALSIGTTRAATERAFDAANAQARDRAVERKLKTAGTSLAEADFPLLIDVRTRDEWRAAFASLDAYAAGVADLGSGGRADATAPAMAAIGEAVGARAGVAEALRGPFESLGVALVRGAGQRDATRIMRATDPAFRAVVHAMADLVGATPAPGTLHGVVLSNWQTALRDAETGYADPSRDEASRRALLRTYVADLSARDAELVRLTALHDALRGLADAHRAAAFGDAAAAAAWPARLAALTAAR